MYIDYSSNIIILPLATALTATIIKRDHVLIDFI